MVDGRLWLKAAQKLGLTEIPVLLCDEWTPAQVKAFRLLVNRGATWADFDEELLALELQDLQAADFDLSLTGFDVRIALILGLAILKLIASKDRRHENSKDAEDLHRLLVTYADARNLDRI